MSANRRQVGGQHYAGRKIQHWDYASQLGYLEGSISKYIDRWQSKGDPLENLEKAGHYLQKLIETNFPDVVVRFDVFPRPQEGASNRVVSRSKAKRKG